MIIIKSDFIEKETMERMLDCLQYPNALALRVALHTGLRISDVLCLKTNKLKQVMYIRESKTDKCKRVYIPVELLHEMQKQAGAIFVFQGRNSIKKHRTRQAVYKDLKRVASLYAIPKNLQISPHSTRKIYAVEKYRECGSLEKVQKLLNHSDSLVTALYAYSDYASNRKRGRKGAN